MRLLILLGLVACVMDKLPVDTGSAHADPDTSNHDTDSGDTDSDSSDSGVVLVYDINSGVTDGELFWAGGAIPYGGYAATAGAEGFYISDPVGDGVSAFVYRIPWGSTDSSAVFIEDLADQVTETQTLGPDKLAYDWLNAELNIPNAAATTDGISYAGIGYSMTEPVESGELSDLAEVGFGGGYENGYTGRTLRLDADGDGAVDDMIVTATAVEGDYYGAIGVWLDVDDGYHIWSSADFEFRVCEDHDDTKIKYGPVDIDIDVSGSMLYVACPSASYRDGSIEGVPVPLDEDSASVGYLYGVSGWHVSADPNGGAWAGASGGGLIAYVNFELGESFGAYPDGDWEDLSYFGTDPQLIKASTGQTLMLVGQSTRTADSPEFFAPVVAPSSMPGSYDPGEVDPAAEDGTDTSAVWLCDVTDRPEADPRTHYARLDCARYTADSVGCTGSVQGLYEADGTLYGYSSGWEYGSGDGCGLTMLRFTLAE